MLKVTYTDTGLHLEYRPEPLSQVLSDRMYTYARAQRPLTMQPIAANIPLAATLVQTLAWAQLQDFELTRCDRDWFEVTLSGLWLTEDPAAETGIFLTELDIRLEQRLLSLWQWSHQCQSQQLRV
ncbi:alr0857 family protein [Halomicronema sp. CCY15110]|uniref:alr0857 family protein n=1 Tax=Halomicronema sp. CCY15110 TaxID=2767773 RepID=UPI00194FC52D|nr:alr0857 family protein [Halomicronema sp. CCY15110]